MEVLSIAGELRAELGKKSTKEVRRNKLVPAVIYGGENPVHFTVKPLDVRDLIYTADFKLAEITVDGKVYKTILKDSHFHPVTDNLLHLDFQELVNGRTINATIPLRVEGSAAGVREGGKMTQKIRQVNIKTKPETLVNALTVDVSTLELGKSLRISDINVPEGIQIMNPASIPVVSVVVPRAMRSEDDVAAVGEVAEVATEGAEEAAAE